MIPVKINGTGGIDPIKAYMTQMKKENTEVNTKADGQVRGDTLEISTEARKIQNYKGMLAELPEVREDLVASLKQRIQEGSYRPDSEKIAAALVKESRLDKIK